jgi:hypothetical protein
VITLKFPARLKTEALRTDSICQEKQDTPNEEQNKKLPLRWLQLFSGFAQRRREQWDVRSEKREARNELS